jgi:predicted lipid-binding transport protein (Tim44 family)
MSKWLLVLTILFVGGALVAAEADAKGRLGGGRSTGIQRTPSTPPASTPAKPAQQAAPAQQQAAPGAAQPAPATGLSRWLPMLGGLALGGLLGSLFSGSGLGGILLVALLAIAAVLAFRAFARRHNAQTPQPMQYAGLGREPVFRAPDVQTPAASSAAAERATQGAPVPAEFDSAGFVRAAKMNFVKLQVANDQGNLDEIREFTTPEMFDVLQRDVLERQGQAPQQTDIVNLDAQLLEVATEGDRHWASVRFTGTVRETAGAVPVGFEEVWNLVKPADGSTGWLLAGIQQMN